MTARLPKKHLPGAGCRPESLPCAELTDARTAVAVIASVRYTAMPRLFEPSPVGRRPGQPVDIDRPLPLPAIQAVAARAVARPVGDVVQP
eukprot:6773611-Prymnesium_polylepis.2